MISQIIEFSIRNRFLVVLAAFGVGAFGIFNFSRLPIDAVPDITNVQVQINSSVPGLSPVEIEKRITYPIETTMSGLPRLEELRSLSRYGLSQVTVVFKDGTDIYRARQLVNERLLAAKEALPPGLTDPVIGPITTGLGEIFLWSVQAEPNARTSEGSIYSPTDLRTIQDWIIRPQILTVPGVTEVNSIGGFEKKFQVTPYPERLIAHHLTFQDVFEALEKNNTFSGGGYIERQGEQYLIQASGLVSGIEDLETISLKTDDGNPVYVKDVAEVSIGKDLRTGAATINAQEGVIGTAMMLLGENSRAVSTSLAAKMQEINRTLPRGVTAKVIYNRTTLVDATIHTVERNLIEGALLVIAVLFLILGNFRVSLFVAATIPLSMLFAVSGMTFFGISGNLLSLGAIDFGIIIDGSVVMAENILRHFAAKQHTLGRHLKREERFKEAFIASREVAGATLSGVSIIMIVYLPILTLTGVEGKMFVPMAQVVLLALLGALIICFTVIPALIAIFLTGKVSENEGRLMKTIKVAYQKILEFVLKRPIPILALVSSVLFLAGLLAPKLGSEFIPKLDERDLAIEIVRIPSTSITQSIKMEEELEKEIQKLPEVKFVFSRIGTAEVASDPMPPNGADCLIIIKPQNEWPNPHKDKETLMSEVSDIVKSLPGNAFDISQPIEMRMNELIAGIKSDIALKIFGDDMEVLRAKGEEALKVISKIKGARGARLEQISGLPMLQIDIDRAAISRLGLNISDIHDVISIAVGGKVAGLVFEGDKRFEIIVRLPEALREQIESIENLPIPVPIKEATRKPVSYDHQQEYEPQIVPLKVLANIRVVDGPAQVSREGGKRRIVVQTNVGGRDLGSFVEEAQRMIAEKLKLPAGYWVQWGGQFENFQAAKTRLEIVVPISLLLILLILFSTFGTVRESLIVFSGVPLALTGGVLALYLRGIPFSISAGVGFIALSGVAVLNGIMVLSFIRKLVENGMSVERAVVEGSLIRLRPVLMTALVASLGFVPMALSHGTGAEVQRPLATVVIGGIISSTILTLIVLPVLYRMFYRSSKREEELPQV